MGKRRSVLWRVGLVPVVGAAVAVCSVRATLTTSARPSLGPRYLAAGLPSRSFELPILLYHRVDRRASTLPPVTRRLTVDPRDFAAQMSWLSRHDFHPVTQHQLLRGLEGEPLPCRPLLITFDDGYSDVLANATPVLRRLGMPATMYVITDRPPMRNSGFLSWRGVKELDRKGFDIGSHTVTHRPLTTLSSEAVGEELGRSRRELERRLGHPVQWLAYPFGAVDARVVELARRAGYVLAVTTRPGLVEVASDRLELPRFEILDSTGVTGLAELLRPEVGAGCRRRLA